MSIPLFLPKKHIQANVNPDFPVELDPTNRFGNAAVYIAYGSEGSRDLARHRVGVPVGGITPNTIGQKGRTKAWAGVTSESYVRDAVMEFPVGTWAAYVRRTGTLPSYARPIGKTYTNGTAAPYVSWDFEYNPGGAGQNIVQASCDISGTATHTAQATFTDTTIPHLVIGTYDGTTLKLYQNSALLVSVAASGTLAYDTSSAGNLIVSGSSASGVANEWWGDIYWAGAWPFAFTQADVNSIVANQYQMLRPKQRDIFIAFSGSPANNLSGSSSQSQTASGSVSVAIPLVGASVQTQTGSAVISTGVAISGSAAATQQANGSLSISIPLSGSAIQQAAATGTVSISVSLAGNAIQQAYASGTLTNTAAGAVNLSGTSSQSQSANGLLSLGNNLSGSSIAVSNASGSLTVLVPLSGVSVQAQQATGSLIVTAAGVNLSGDAVQQALATGSLTMRINLSGESVQQAISSAYLSASGGMVSNPQWTINSSSRNWQINATGRNWTI